MAEQLYVELGTADLSRALGVTQRTVQRRIASGKLSAVRDPAGRYRVPTPTRVAARALGVSQRTVQRQAEAGKLRAFRGSEREAEAAYTPRPPTDLVNRARDPQRFGNMDTGAARRWLTDEGPDWLSRKVMGGVALPIEGAIIMAGAGVPPPDGWGSTASTTPYADGTARVVLGLANGDTIDLGTMPGAVAWDMRRGFTGEGIDVDVEDTPTGGKR